MNIRNRLDRLEAASRSTGEAPRVVTEEDFEELSCEDKLRYLRGQLDLRLVSEDAGPTLAEAYVAAGVPPFEATPGEANYGAARISDAQRRVYTEYMDGCGARYAARRAARLAAKAEAPGTSMASVIEEEGYPC